MKGSLIHAEEKSGHGSDLRPCRHSANNRWNMKYGCIYCKKRNKTISGYAQKYSNPYKKTCCRKLSYAHKTSVYTIYFSHNASVPAPSGCRSNQNKRLSSLSGSPGIPADMSFSSILNIIFYFLSCPDIALSPSLAEKIHCVIF